MKPRYQLRKKIVHGITKLRRRCTSSWNSGDRSIASQSIVGLGTLQRFRHVLSSS